MACPKCGKRVPSRYRYSHALFHLNKKKDVIWGKTSQVKTMWEGLKLAIPTK
jgi:hypothetical protein